MPFDDTSNGGGGGGDGGRHDPDKFARIIKQVMSSLDAACVKHDLCPRCLNRELSMALLLRMAAIDAALDIAEGHEETQTKQFEINNLRNIGNVMAEQFGANFDRLLASGKQYIGR